jgi:hypothetical protein
MSSAAALESGIAYLSQVGNRAVPPRAAPHPAEHVHLGHPYPPQPCGMVVMFDGIVVVPLHPESTDDVGVRPP